MEQQVLIWSRLKSLDNENIKNTENKPAVFRFSKKNKLMENFIVFLLEAQQI